VKQPLKSAVVVFGLVIWVLPVLGGLTVNYTVDGTLITTTDDTGTKANSVGSSSEIYSEPSFDGVNMGNELNVVLFPDLPSTSLYWAVLINASPGQSGPGNASVSLTQLTDTDDNALINWGESAADLQFGNYSPGVQSFAVTFSGDLPTYAEVNGYYTEVGDQSFSYDVDVNVTFDSVPDRPGSMIDIALLLPLALAGVLGLRRSLAGN